MITEVRTCPLGHECVKAEGGVISKCAWYVKLQGNDPQTGERVDKEDCAIAWQPILLIEANAQAARTTSSVQSMRNESVIRQDQAIEALKHAAISKD